MLLIKIFMAMTLANLGVVATPTAFNIGAAGRHLADCLITTNIQGSGEGVMQPLRCRTSKNVTEMRNLSSSDQKHTCCPNGSECLANFCFDISCIRAKECAKEGLAIVPSVKARFLSLCPIATFLECVKSCWDRDFCRYFTWNEHTRTCNVSDIIDGVVNLSGAHSGNKECNPRAKLNLQNQVVVAESSECLESDTQYRLKQVVQRVSVEDASDCAAHCSKMDLCHFWTFNQPKRICALAKMRMGSRSRESFVSGTKQCLSRIAREDNVANDQSHGNEAALGHVGGNNVTVPHTNSNNASEEFRVDNLEDSSLNTTDNENSRDEHYHEDGGDYYGDAQSINDDDRGNTIVSVADGKSEGNKSSHESKVGNKDVGTSHQGVNMEGNNMDGNNTKGNNVEGNNIEGNNMEGNNMEGNNTDGTNMEGNNMEGNNIEGNNMEGNNIEGNDTKGNNMEGNNIEGNNIEGNDTKGNSMEGNNMEGNDTKGTKEDKESKKAEKEGSKEAKDQVNKDESNASENNEDNKESNTTIKKINEMEKTEKSENESVNESASSNPSEALSHSDSTPTEEIIAEDEAKDDTAFTSVNESRQHCPVDRSWHFDLSSFLLIHTANNKDVWVDIDGECKLENNQMSRELARQQHIWGMGFVFNASQATICSPSQCVGLNPDSGSLHWTPLASPPSTFNPLLSRPVALRNGGVWFSGSNQVLLPRAFSFEHMRDDIQPPRHFIDHCAIQVNKTHTLLIGGRDVHYNTYRCAFFFDWESRSFSPLAKSMQKGKFRPECVLFEENGHHKVLIMDQYNKQEDNNSQQPEVLDLTTQTWTIRKDLRWPDANCKFRLVQGASSSEVFLVTSNHVWQLEKIAVGQWLWSKKRRIVDIFPDTLANVFFLRDVNCNVFVN